MKRERAKESVKKGPSAGSGGKGEYNEYASRGRNSG